MLQEDQNGYHGQRFANGLSADCHQRLGRAVVAVVGLGERRLKSPMSGNQHKYRPPNQSGICSCRLVKCQFNKIMHPLTPSENVQGGFLC